MKLFYSGHFVLPLPEGHRFPTEKYARLWTRIREAELVEIDDFRVPELASDRQLHLAHDPEYVRKVQEGDLTAAEVRRMGFPWSPALVERSRRSVGGSIGAARAALDDGVAANLSGGTHHAFSDRGEGFCVFNDLAVAARVVQEEGLARRIVILDLDVHQGNGTAAIFSGDASVLTVSVHGADNYPFRKEASDLDIELPDGIGDEPFLAAVQDAVHQAVDGASPELVLYIAGADPFEGDRLGRMSVTKEGLRRRDRMVTRHCLREGVPLAVVMGGGYAHDLSDSVDIHFRTIQTAVEMSVELSDRSSALGPEAT